MSNGAKLRFKRTSPAQGSVAPESNQFGTLRHIQQDTNQQQRKSVDTVQSTTNVTNKDDATPGDNHRVPSKASSVKSSRSSTDSNQMLRPKVCLSRLKAEDEVLMQQSLKQFAKKSPGSMESSSSDLDNTICFQK